MNATTIASQVDAVHFIVKATLGERFTEGTNAQEIMTKDDRAACIAYLVSGLSDNTISIKSVPATDAKLRSYASGLLTNWLLKSKVLNGGQKYEVKNPGIRSDSEQIKQAKALRAVMVAKGESTEVVDAFIAANTVVKVKADKTLDVSALPEELQALAG
jgi:hypothetical protein